MEKLKYKGSFCFVWNWRASALSFFLKQIIKKLMGRKRKDKKNPNNPYLLDELEDGDQRIGSLTDQGVSIKVDVKRQVTKTNISENTFG